MWKISNPRALLVGIQIGSGTMEDSMKGPQKIKNGIALWPSNPTSGNKSEKTQNTNLKGYMHPYVHCSIIYKRHMMEATQVPINRQVDKTIVVHIYNGILFGHKKWNLSICNSIDGPKWYYAK